MYASRATVSRSVHPTGGVPCQDRRRDMEAARPSHRGGVGRLEKPRSRAPIRLPALPIEQGIGHSGSSRVHQVVQRIYGNLLHPHSVSGGVTPSAGSITCSLPQTAPKCAAVAAGPESPAAARSPRTPPHTVPYPQWTRLEKRASLSSSIGWTPSTLVAACAGAGLAGRPRSFISIVLEIVITAVPAIPAKIPLPKAAAISPIFTRISLLVLPLAFLTDVTRLCCSLVRYFLLHLNVWCEF